MFCRLAQLTFGCCNTLKMSEKSILMFRKKGLVLIMPNLIERTLCKCPRIELRAWTDDMMEHARIWFDHTVCDLNTDAFRRFASDSFILTGGEIDVDLTALRSGRIEFWNNPTVHARVCDSQELPEPTDPLPPYNTTPDVMRTEIEVIDSCVDLLRKTCAQSGVFDPDLYPNNDSTRKNASER